ncbi:MAG: rRNA pseudouridine synthase [Clostridia bacterium]|nr:rRNA pseudouridine synthase [Clostridia bacterium]
MEKIRLQKYFTECGIMSRRAAEAEIEAGKVTVNGHTASLGDKIDPEADVVMYNGKILEYTAAENIYIMLHKPRGYLTSMSDDRGRKCVSELVSDLGSRVYPIGRLDLNSEGLLLMTDDGELANILTHPKYCVGKIYNVSVRGDVNENVLNVLRAPMIIDGYKTKGAEVEVVEKYDGGAKLKITLHEGRNREIRKMCEQVELKVGRLCRVQIGDIKLGGLALGKWRHLDRSQVKYLKNIKSKAK